MHVTLVESLGPLAEAAASSGEKNLRVIAGKEVTMREPTYAEIGCCACSTGTW